MFKKILKIAIAAALAPVGVAYAQEADKLAALEERISELEANSSLNIFNFRGTFITRYDDVSAKQTEPAMGAYDHKNLGYLRMRFSLDMDANVSKHLKFYSRFTTTKHYNGWTTTGTRSPMGEDLYSADRYASSALVLEKAYLDMSIPNSYFTVSLGRLPTADGAPTHYWDGRARMGTYPLLSYGAILDGAAITYKMDEFMPEGHKLAARVVYSPFSSINIDAQGSPYQIPPTHNGSVGGGNIGTFADFFTLQLDYATGNLGFAENFGLILQYNKLSPLNVPSQTAADNLRFGLQSSSATVEFNGIAGTPLDFLVSHLMTDLHSEGLYTVAPGVSLGFGTATDDDKVKGSMTLVSSRYRLGSWILGLEYGHGTKGLLFAGATAEDITNMYGTPGDLYHGYVTKKFTDTLSLRLGYYKQDEKHTRITVGPVQDSDRKVDVGYAQFRADF